MWRDIGETVVMAAVGAVIVLAGAVWWLLIGGVI